MACAPPKRLSTPANWLPPMPATPPSATPSFPPTPRTDPPAESAAPGRASSASTPTMRGTSPAATTRSGDGSTPQLRATLTVDIAADDHRPPRHRRVAPADDDGRPRSTSSADADPPSPQALTNAIGTVTDDVDNLLREQPDLFDLGALDLTGDESWHLAVVERGTHPAEDVDRLRLGRADLEDLFRTLATERRRDRLDNPALAADRVDSILATCCAVLAVMRRLQFVTACALRPSTTVH